MLNSSSVDLSWSAPVYNGPYPITGYHIVGPSGSVITTGTVYTFYGLSPGTTYTFSATTLNEFQSSAPTSTVGITLPTASGPMTFSRLLQWRIYDAPSTAFYNAGTGLIDDTVLYDDVTSSSFTGSGCLPTGSRYTSTASIDYSSTYTLNWNGATSWYMPTGLTPLNFVNPAPTPLPRTANWTYVWYEPGLDQNSPNRITWGSGFSEDIDIHVEGSNFDGTEIIQIIADPSGTPTDVTNSSLYVDINNWLVSGHSYVGSNIIRITRGVQVIESNQFAMSGLV